MNDEELDISRFLSAERAHGLGDESEKADVLARLEASLGPLPPSGGGGGSGGSGGSGTATMRAASAGALAGKAGLLLAGFVAGFAAHASFGSPHGVSATQLPVLAARAVERPSASPTSPISAEGPAAISPNDLPSVAAESSRPAGTTAAAVSARSDDQRRSDLEVERTLLETARTALTRGDHAHAMSALEQYRTRFPQGQLREERESLTIYTLVASGRRAEARAGAAAFRRTFPSSMQGPALDALVEDAR